MDFEKQNTIEKYKNGRERLIALEKEGEFVFHGSPDVIEVLEPRQAYQHDREAGQKNKDGEPAVFATTFADLAIFRSLINERLYEDNSESGASIGDDDILHLYTTSDLVNNAQKTKLVGHVYVFYKKDFGNFKGLDCRSEKSISPVEVIDVKFEDLPKNIKIIE